jgi:hypothetical protein
MRRLFVLLLACVASLCARAADVPTFRSGEYAVTTTIASSEPIMKRVCLTAYDDWFNSLRSEFAERGCELAPDGQTGNVYRYHLDCANGTGGTMEVTQINASTFTSVATINIAIAGFTQSISTRDRAERVGDCPDE